MNWLCKMVGHKPPVYAKKGWYSPGEEYAKVQFHAEDNIGRQHALVYAECARCGEKFTVCRIHLPQRPQDAERIAKLEAQTADSRRAALDELTKLGQEMGDYDLPQKGEHAEL